MDTADTDTGTSPAGSPRGGKWPPRLGRLHSRIAAVVVVLVIATLASRWFVERDSPPAWKGDPAPPPHLAEAVNQVFTEGRCISAAEADETIRVRLHDLGYAEWEIKWGPGVQSKSCVGAAVDTVAGRIVLIRGLRPEVKEALMLVADELLNLCLGKEEAAGLITSALTGLGETGWQLRTDGPIGGPLDRLDEVERHVDAGCFIYSGTGLTADGGRVYYIGGRQG
jgi:hypothetical protein